MPRRRRAPADDGAVVGPTSALTSFLREQGISADSVRQRYEENVRLEEEQNARRAELENVGEEEEEEAEIPANHELSSDEEVYEENEEGVRIRELARNKRRRNAGDDSEDVGKNYCLECDKEFVISVYSKRMEKYGRVGYLCGSCTKLAIRRERLAKRNELEARKKRKRVAAALLDRQVYRIPSLQDECIRIITDNIESVELLGDIGATNRQKICRILAKKRSLNSETMRLFLDPQLKELEFWDCSKIDKGALDQVAALCPQLERLNLNMCGHLHKDNMAYYEQKLPNLRYLRLNGPFLLNDETWQNFFDSKVGRQLKGFHLSNTHRFTSDSLVALLDNVGPQLEELTLSKLDGLDSKAVYDLLPHYLHSLRHLELSYLHKEDLVDDDMIVNLVSQNGENLESLNLDACFGLTDVFLVSGLKPFCPRLTSLSLRMLDQISDEGLSMLFSDWDINGGLMTLDLSRCLSLTDEGVYKALEHSSQTLVELKLNSVKGISKQLFLRLSRNLRFPLLTSLDLGFVRSVDDSVLAIWSRIAPKLSLVEVYGDNRCTDKANVRPDLKVIGREAE